MALPKRTRKFLQSEHVGRLLCLLALMCFLSAPPALSQDSFSFDREWSDAKGWSVAWNDARQGCFAVGQFQNGTFVWMGLGSRGGFIALAHEEYCHN